MGLFDRLKGLFSTQNDVKSIESIDHRFKSIEEPKMVSVQSEIPTQPIAITAGSISNYGESEHLSPIKPELQQESYQLGLAAGYTGRSIKEIEASLSRIEAQMVTKDWFALQINQMDRRVEDIERALGIIKGAIPAIEQQKAAIVKRMPLTHRMEELLAIVRDTGEISFADLALKMNIDVSDLRSLLSIMTKRTNMIERYRMHRAGWIKYVGDQETTSRGQIQ